MRKDWLWVGAVSLLLAACSSTTEQSPPAPKTWQGPVVEIGGVEPRYEPVNPATSQDYSVNGKTYHIVTDPENYSETGLAAWYGEEAQGNRTSTGETFDPEALTAAHPTLPLPGYVRVTNLANGRQLVVRINDRGPYTAGRIIDLSRAAGNRLNISNNTRVRIDYIKVAPDGTLSGPGTVGTTVAKQSYALPARPSLGGAMTLTGTAAITQTSPAQPMAEENTRPVDISTSDNGNTLGAPVRSQGFLGAPTPLRAGVLEGSDTAAPATTATRIVTAPVAATAVATPSSEETGYVVQVGALSDGPRARQWLATLKQRFSAPGRVLANGHVYRVQLGPFRERQRAAELQQRLEREAQQPSFITTAHNTM